MGAAKAGATAREGFRGEPLLFGLLLLTHLAPIALLGPWPTQDGPSHLANASVLGQLLSGACPIVTDTYAVRWEIFPNWLERIALVGLVRMLPPPAAEALLQSGYVVAFAFALRRVVGGIRPGSRFLALAGFPLVYAYPFLMGFYGFSLGIPVALWLYDHWARHADDPGVPSLLGLAALGGLLFFAHGVAFAAACVLVGGGVASRTLASLRDAPEAPGRARRALLRHVAPPLAALAPAGLLALNYALHSSSGLRYVDAATAGKSGLALAGHQLVDLIGARQLVAYGPVEAWIAGAFAGVLLLAGALCLRRRRELHARRPGLLAACAAFALLYFATPDFTGKGGFLSDRIALWLWLGLVLWLASFRHPEREARRLALALTGVALALLAAKLSVVVRVNDLLDEYRSVAGHLEEGRTLVPLQFLPGDRRHGGEPSLEVDPLVHASGDLVAGRCLVSLDNYEAGLTDHFPTAFRPGRNPYRLAGYNAYRPEQLDLGKLAAAGIRVDYVLVWGAEPALARVGPRRREAMRRQLRRIERDYERVHVSPQRGWLELYRLRPAGPARGGGGG